MTVCKDDGIIFIGGMECVQHIEILDDTTDIFDSLTICPRHNLIEVVIAVRQSCHTYNGAFRYPAATFLGLMELFHHLKAQHPECRSVACEEIDICCINRLSFLGHEYCKICKSRNTVCFCQFLNTRQSSKVVGKGFTLSGKVKFRTDEIKVVGM